MPTMTRTTGNVIAGLLALALVGGLVIRTSSAVFTAQTDNTGNSLEAGTIVLTDDDAGTAALTMSNIAPGEYSQNCLVVEYDGTLDPEPVKVFSTSAFRTTPATTGPGTAAANMQNQVNITIEQGAGSSSGGFGSCAGFVTGATLVDAVPLDTWHAGARDYVSGAGSWDPALGPDQTRMYRITLELDLETKDDFQGARLSGINLSWATRSTDTPGLVP